MHFCAQRHSKQKMQDSASYIKHEALDKSVWLVLKGFVVVVDKSVRLVLEVFVVVVVVFWRVL